MTGKISLDTIGHRIIKVNCNAVTIYKINRKNAGKTYSISKIMKYIYVDFFHQPSTINKIMFQTFRSVKIFFKIINIFIGHFSAKKLKRVINSFIKKYRKQCMLVFEISSDIFKMLAPIYSEM